MSATDLRFRMQEVWIRNNMYFLHRYWSTARSALEAVADAPETFEEFKDNDLGDGYVNAVLSSHFEHHTYSGVLMTYAGFPA